MGNNNKTANDKAYSRGYEEGKRSTFANDIMGAFTSPITNALDRILPDSPSQRAHKAGYQEGKKKR